MFAKNISCKWENKKMWNKTFESKQTWDSLIRSFNNDSGTSCSEDMIFLM